MNACFKFEMVEKPPMNWNISGFTTVISPTKLSHFNFWRFWPNFVAKLWPNSRSAVCFDFQFLTKQKFEETDFFNPKIHRNDGRRNRKFNENRLFEIPVKNLPNFQFEKQNKKLVKWQNVKKNVWFEKNSSIHFGQIKIKTNIFFQSFDPSLKKKKKKKKTPFDLDGALNDAEGDNETPEPAKDENLDDLDLENFGKKKKKKKKVGEGDEEKGDKEKDESEDIDLESFGKKKKPKKKKNINLDELKEALDDDNKENGKVLTWKTGCPNKFWKKTKKVVKLCLYSS